LVRTRKDFKNISVNDVNASLLLIIHLPVLGREIKENILIALVAVKQPSFTMTIPITQTSVAVIKNVTIPSGFQS
jgi:hypothetical protein